jgi:amidase
MQLPHVDWRAQAEAKVAATLSKIPVEWRLEQDVIKEAKNRRQLAGDFIIHLLDRETVRCISHDSNEIVDLIKKKTYTSVEVARAFCKTAAVAHQIVGIS